MKLHCWLWGHEMAAMTPPEVEQEIQRAIRDRARLCLVKCSRCEERLPEPPHLTPWGLYLTPVVLGGILAVIAIWVWP